MTPHEIDQITAVARNTPRIRLAGVGTQRNIFGEHTAYVILHDESSHYDYTTTSLEEALAICGYYPIISPAAKRRTPPAS